MGYLLYRCLKKKFQSVCWQESDAFRYKVNKKVERIAHLNEKN